MRAAKTEQSHADSICVLICLQNEWQLALVDPGANLKCNISSFIPENKVHAFKISFHMKKAVSGYVAKTVGITKPNELVHNALHAMSSH